MAKKEKNKHMNTKKHMKEKKQSGFKRFVLIVIEFVLLALIVYAGYHIVMWIKENIQNNDIKKELENVVTVNNTANENDRLYAKNYDIDFDSLNKTNSDTIGWIKVNNTNMEYPVVKSSDNDFYLTHSFNKSYNSAGWIFADYRNKIDGTDKNIIIYGHNRKDASMFGTLKDALESDWYQNEQNRNIVFITPDEKCDYEIFSEYRIQVEDYYITTVFKKGEFTSFAETLKKRSIHDFDVDVGEDDSILTLSTCSGNDYRMVIHAKKIKGE